LPVSARGKAPGPAPPENATHPHLSNLRQLDLSDLKAERNALHERVFPALEALCEERQARFQAIDLRWGVREEAGLDQQTMRICLDEDPQRRLISFSTVRTTVERAASRARRPSVCQ
jgi:hypothetical protein